MCVFLAIDLIFWTNSANITGSSVESVYFQKLLPFVLLIEGLLYLSLMFIFDNLFSFFDLILNSIPYYVLASYIMLQMSFFKSLLRYGVLAYELFKFPLYVLGRGGDRELNTVLSLHSVHWTFESHFSVVCCFILSNTLYLSYV